MSAVPLPTVKKGTFFSPEALGYTSVSPGAHEVPLQAEQLDQLTDWDIAIRYHELKSRRSAAEIQALRRFSAASILARAQRVLGSVTHPVEKYIASWPDLPPDAGQVELDLEETLENSPFGVSTHADLWMEYNRRRQQELLLTVDTSLSMTGEKLALTAVALAVVVLQFPDDPIGIIAFENEARVIKRPEERVTVPQLVERFLDVPAQGYTHLEEGVAAALKLSQSLRGRTRRPPSLRCSTHRRKIYRRP